MTLTLETSRLQLTLDPGNATWSLSGSQNYDPELVGVRCLAEYRAGEQPRRALETWTGVETAGPLTVESLHGPLRQIHLAFRPGPDGLQLTLTFALPELHPFLLWRLSAENHGRDPVRLDRLELLRAGPLPGSPGRQPASSITRLRSPSFFSNGWQSWSYCGVYRPEDRFRRTRLGFFRTPTDVNAGTPQPGDRGHFASDFFGILGDRETRAGLLVGFLSQRQHFGSLEAWIAGQPPALRLWANGDGARLDPGANISTDWACASYLNIDEPDPFQEYTRAVAREHSLDSAHSGFLTAAPGAHASEGGGWTAQAESRGCGADPDIPTGWCSWYQYSSENYIGRLAAQDISKNLAALKSLQPRLPLRLFQIDDGFEPYAGDWFSFVPAFSQGVSPLAAEIRAAGYTPGLWLAPFIAHPRSRLARQHPGWLLRGRFNRPANAGYLWNSFAHALDLTHPAAMEYVDRVVRTAVHDWGFPYLKLDFLFAAALPGRYLDPTRTRAQVLRAGLETVRAAAREGAYLLGCGCPLGPAIGLVDAMRIGADTARHWRPAFPGLGRFVGSEPNLPSARNSLHNALTRAPFHRRWWVNDPDCLLLNPRGGLSSEEARTAATLITLSGGSLLLSDDLAALPPESLRVAEVLLPPTGQAARVLDWFDSADPQRLRLDLKNATGAWHLLALANWADHPQELIFRLEQFGLQAGSAYHAREFWSGVDTSITGGFLACPDVPAHGILLLAVRPRSPGQPQYLGSDLHLSQGLEVADWEPGPQALHLRLERPGPAQGSIVLALPRPPGRAAIDGRPLDWQPAGIGIYRFPVQFSRSARIRIDFA